jgi:guanyl-specific ribonuclease Sa
LNKTLDDLIVKVGTTKTTVRDGRRDRLAAFKTRLGTPLTGMAIDFAATKLSPQDRKNLVAELSGFESNPNLPVNTTTIEASVAALEKAYTNARDKTAGLKLKKTQEQERLRREEERQAKLNDAEREKEAALKATIAGVIPSYNLLLAKCTGGLEQLGELASFIKKGEDTLLNNCLNQATSDQVLKLFKIHNTNVSILNKLLMAAGESRIDFLARLLKEVDEGEEQDLLKLLRAHDSPAADLLELLKLIIPSRVDQLLEQGTSTVLVDLFVTRNIEVQPAIDLLKSDAGHRAVEMLTSVPDPAFLLKLQGLAPDAEQLWWVVTDLPKKAKAVTKAKAMVKKSGAPATWADVVGITEVQESRGLRTAAGAVIPMKSVDDLDEHPKKHVKKCLAGIAKGEAPVLTHPDGAKFGDSFNNDQGRLPGVRGAGGYKEYYVEKHPDSDEYHGQRRVVVSDDTGFVYLTLDHYATFRRIV